MNYDRFVQVCIRKDQKIPLALRHWAWNMQKPGMTAYAKKIGKTHNAAKIHAFCIAAVMYSGVKL